MRARSAWHSDHAEFFDKASRELSIQNAIEAITPDDRPPDMNMVPLF